MKKSTKSKTSSDAKKCEVEELAELQETSVIDSFNSVRKNTFANVIDILLGFSREHIVTSEAIEWMGMHFSVIIITEDRGTPEETILQIEDLLRNTILDHRIREFNTLVHATHESIPHQYCGTTVLHDNVDDAIDYANYMRIRLNN